MCNSSWSSEFEERTPPILGKRFWCPANCWRQVFGVKSFSDVKCFFWRQEKFDVKNVLEVQISLTSEKLLTSKKAFDVKKVVDLKNVFDVKNFLTSTIFLTSIVSWRQQFVWRQNFFWRQTICWTSKTNYFCSLAAFILLVCFCWFLFVDSLNDL